jgi:CRISPR/Cas system-associated exonuclease Cas4 (RecB family)
MRAVYKSLLVFRKTYIAAVSSENEKRGTHMAKRVESPSSINTFKQCKRKYYYNYIAKLPTIPNIHQVRGNIAHSTLEYFFDIDVNGVAIDKCRERFQRTVQKLFHQTWNQAQKKLQGLDLSQDQHQFYFEETMLMLMNWTNQHLTPIREQQYRSDNYSVRGFIDAIKHVEDEVHIIDYKTNARFDFKESIKLQLAIYSLLYFEKHGELPSKVGIFFLRHKLKMINVDEELLTLARREIELVHGHTSITEEINDYPRTITPLCKWSTGQCDFYETCLPHEKGK